VPDTGVFSNFTDLFDKVRSKPPIGYLTAISAALGGLGTSSVPYSLGDVSAFSGIFSPIRTALAWVLWFVFAFWVVHRLRNLAL
jgi:hypothetical protein